MSYESIKEAINSLKIDADHVQMTILVKLHDQFEKASNSSFSKQELETEIKENNNVLDSVDQDTFFYECVSSIQDSIILFFWR